MKTEEEIRAMLKELEERRSTSPNMNYEIAGAKTALEWALGERDWLGAGIRMI